jgi:glycosyltransferase involved in cell wall biosynthesis
MNRFSIIIPVLNEAGEINDLISHLRGLQGGRGCELIVVDGSAEKDTVKAITDPDVHGLSSPRGRAGQMNAGAAAAKGDILIFLHADTRLPMDALELIDKAMAQPCLA